MTNFLVKLFIKDYEKTSSPVVRRRFGVFSGILGIVLNIILFSVKMIAGVLTGAISVLADAINNLSDAGSSIVTMVGFKLSGQKPDKDHPFGHGRIEYVAGLIVSIAIIVMGIEIFTTSIDKVLNPTSVVFSVVSMIILAVSVIVKLWMYFYNRKIAKMINSPALRATATDSICDAISTFVVLVGMIISYYTNVNLDAYLGIGVALFIFYSGYNACKDTISPLVGEAPNKELVNDIVKLVMSHKEIKGMHDFIMHSYGSNKVLLTFHAEVDSHGDVFEIHDIIDDIERDIKNEFNVLTTIHMDPIEQDNAHIDKIKEKVISLMKEIDSKITIHDFRMTASHSHCNLIFDLVKPFELDVENAEMQELITEKIATLSTENFKYFAVVDIDDEYCP